MLRIVNLQLLSILTTLLLVACNPSRYIPEPEEEFDIGSGSEGIKHEKRPYEKGNDYLGKKEIKFMYKQQDMENNDHLGSHGLGVGKVPQGATEGEQPNVGKDFIPKENESTDKGSSYGGKDFIPKENESTNKDSSYGGKDFIPKENESTNKGSSYGGKDFIPKENESTNKGSSYGGKDFIPMEKESTDKGSSYGGKDFIPKEKESTDKGSSNGEKDFIPKEKNYLDNPFPYDSKDSVHKGDIPINGVVDIYNVDKNSNDEGTDSSYGFSHTGNDGPIRNGERVDSQGGKDVTYSYGNDKGVDNPYQEKNHVSHDDRKDLGNREYPKRVGDYPKFNPYHDDSSEEDPGFFDNFGTILHGLKDKIKSIGHKAEKKVRSTLGHLKESHTEAREGFSQPVGTLRDFWDKFWNFWGKVDRVAKRGYQYVLQGFSADEVKDSQLLEKLGRGLFEGDKIVNQFFKKVGEKVSKWLQQHGHDDVDEGLFAPEKEVEEQLSNPQFPNLFQDVEIHQELDKLVQSGIMQQEEVDQLSKSQIVYQDKKKVKVQENSNGLFDDKKILEDDKLDFVRDDPKLKNVVQLSRGSTEPKLPSEISDHLKAWVDSIDKLVSP